MKPKKEDPVAYFAWLAADDAEKRFRHVVGTLIRRCESPIEVRMLCALYYMLRIEMSWETDIHWHGGDFKFGQDADTPIPSTDVYVQAALGPYRVDLLLDVHVGEHRKTLVIECDGHDFHERTKEQARRDRSRDRWMTERGITLLRFTGSEIWRDALACAQQIADVYCYTIKGYSRGPADGTD